jgi:hypothetical protein
MESAFLLLTIADWRQTLDIKNHPNAREGNPLLGTNPTDAQVNRYFISATATQYLIANALPEKWRDRWIAGGIGLEIAVVGRNYRLGMNAGF